jgi:hypothetical protein
MIDTLNKQGRAKFILVFFVVYSLWWLAIQFWFHSDTNQLDLFTISYGVMAVLGAIFGFGISERWGGKKSLIGKAIWYFSLGLLLQEFGQLVYTYYIYIRHVEVPYPSLGDAGFFGSIPSYVYGTLILAKASGVHFSLKSTINKIQVVVIPLIGLGLSYYVFLVGYNFNWSNPLIILLDFGYPFGQVIYIIVALLTYLLSRKILGGIMRSKIFWILAALVVQYIADYIFLFQASRGKWAISGISDYIYFCAYFFMAFALLQFKTVLSAIKDK